MRSYAGYKSVQATWHSGGSLLHCLDEATKGLRRCQASEAAKLRMAPSWHLKKNVNSPISWSQVLSPFSRPFFQVSIDAVLDVVSQCFSLFRCSQVWSFASAPLRVLDHSERSSCTWPRGTRSSLAEWRILPSESLQVSVRTVKAAVFNQVLSFVHLYSFVMFCKFHRCSPSLAIRWNLTQLIESSRWNRRFASRSSAAWPAMEFGAGQRLSGHRGATDGDQAAHAFARGRPWQWPFRFCKVARGATELQLTILQYSLYIPIMTVSNLSLLCFFSLFFSYRSEKSLLVLWGVRSQMCRPENGLKCLLESF